MRSKSFPLALLTLFLVTAAPQVFANSISPHSPQPPENLPENLLATPTADASQDSAQESSQELLDTQLYQALGSSPLDLDKVRELMRQGAKLSGKFCFSEPVETDFGSTLMKSCDLIIRGLSIRYIFYGEATEGFARAIHWGVLDDRQDSEIFSQIFRLSILFPPEFKIETHRRSFSAMKAFLHRKNPKLESTREEITKAIKHLSGLQLEGEKLAIAQGKVEYLKTWLESSAD